MAKNQTQTLFDLVSAEEIDLLQEEVDALAAGFVEMPGFAGASISSREMGDVLREVAVRLHDNYPYFHPLYAGQMLKPPHPVARLAYTLAMIINPNNHALDGGRASSAMEKEAVAEIGRMFGWETHLGHLCGGGTVANLEALWVARELNPGATVVASEQAHYTHSRISGVLGIPFEPVSCDDRARMNLNELEDRLKKGGVGTVVATIGTTATGSVDPLPELLDLRERHGFRLHADCAYGGYFVLVDHLADETRRSFDRLGEVDSLVIDPHKHGLQPYGCGCVLFRDPAVGRFYKHESPYTYFSSDELHLGEISLECSRAGAAAVALRATQRLLPLERGGVFAAGLEKSRAAAVALHGLLERDIRFIPAFQPELDIVVWAPAAGNLPEVSRRARRIYDEAAKRGLHLALAQLPARFFARVPGSSGDSPDSTVTCLRSVLMKPEHLDWIDRMWEILDRAAEG